MNAKTQIPRGQLLRLDNDVPQCLPPLHLASPPSFRRSPVPIPYSTLLGHDNLCEFHDFLEWQRSARSHIPGFNYYI